MKKQLRPSILGHDSNLALVAARSESCPFRQFRLAKVFALAMIAGGLVLSYCDLANAQIYPRSSSPFGNYGPYITRPYAAYGYGGGLYGGLYNRSYYRAPVELYAPRNYDARPRMYTGYSYLYGPSYYWNYGYRPYNYRANSTPNTFPGRTQPQGNAGAAPNRVAIQVTLPAANAQLWFAGVKTNQTGKLREFVTPPLEMGKRYQYKVRVVWNENGSAQERTRTIQIEPGQNLQLDFTSAQQKRASAK